MLSHELRNPLAPISAAAQLLQTMNLDEVKVQHSCQIINRNVRHMTELIDDLLHVSRVSQGLVTLDSVPLRIRDIVASSVEQATPLIQARRHTLKVQLPPDMDMVLGDEKRLTQVVVNLLDNAAKYTLEGGNITVEIGVDESDVVIEVLDNGIGMEAALASRVFDLFIQGQRSSDRSSGGLGIRLALVKSLVALHHGSVTCTSAGLGHGSKFTVRLPRFQDRRRDDRHAEERIVSGTVTPLRVMIVDDNIDAAEMLAMLLQASGHQVLVEHAPLQALELSRREVPQVLLLDIGLPEIDGIELARRLRAQPETSRSTLVAITGYGSEEDRKATSAAGFDHHLLKPVDTQRLVEILASVQGAAATAENASDTPRRRADERSR